ncbi:hypothetical protein GCM10019059_07430 [Camelimonas fluminis]|uniref:Uncharacterized protein n=1 Tax=Camelimonas fluminis TaxID=1576911 RepID=A0ABV7UEY3_9HYPH|nr:hypothetical protein [Camelimonas fluminis]GHE50845.1 hypothetical protein GCM10019059_07430 [Camelimonas fluminis]
MSEQLTEFEQAISKMASRELAAVAGDFKRQAGVVLALARTLGDVVGACSAGNVTGVEVLLSDSYCHAHAAAVGMAGNVKRLLDRGVH